MRAKQVSLARIPLIRSLHRRDITRDVAILRRHASKIYGHIDIKVHAQTHHLKSTNNLFYISHQLFRTSSEIILRYQLVFLVSFEGF